MPLRPPIATYTRPRRCSHLRIHQKPICAFQRRSVSLPARLLPFADEIRSGTLGPDPSDFRTARKQIPIFTPPPSSRAVCTDPLGFVTSSQIAIHDPDGSKTALVSRRSPGRLRPGDILLVSRRNLAPVSGHLIMVRNRGIDSSILLRNELTRVGVEIYIKVYSPLVEKIELVQRWKKRARRARITFIRKPQHDKGTTETIVAEYLKKKRAYASGTLSSAIQLTRGKKKQGTRATKTNGGR
ncbi:MAG: hypothetical protein M1814_001655 [Vezdaea aestivalis]|nr:MAG: hypothetical protein M1814_001655 [Vezdaea aestivalis]